MNLLLFRYLVLAMKHLVGDSHRDGGSDRLGGRVKIGGAGVGYGVHVAGVKIGADDFRGPACGQSVHRRVMTGEGGA